MKGDFETIKERFQESLSLLKLAADQLKSTNDPVLLRYHWSAVVKHAANATAALIGCAKSNRHTKGLGYRIKNKQRSDADLNYVFRSRNAEDHPTDYQPSSGAAVKDKSFSIPGVIEVSGNSSVIFDSCLVQTVDGSFGLLHGLWIQQEALQKLN